MIDKQVNLKFRQTMVDLNMALEEWDKIPEGGESEMEVVKKRASELFERLKKQMEEFSL